MADRLEHELMAALAAAEAGRWEESHAIVQRHEGERRFDWIHAVLHRIEGDEGNARYWYRRAGRPADAHALPEEELAAIRAALQKPGA